MANQEQLAILKQGVEAWNQWREKHSDIEPDLKEADLRGADLPGANLSAADLRKAWLPDANLSAADLENTNLHEASLFGADLRQANLNGANLSRANMNLVTLSQAHLRRATLIETELSNTDLFFADLTEANLSNANLSSAYLQGAILINANLSGAKLYPAIDDPYYGDNILISQSSGLSRVTDLSSAFLSGANLRGANLQKVILNHANLYEADLSGADLRYASLVETNLKKANLTGCLVYGISAWDVILDGAMQTNLIITPHPESARIAVDDLEVAQFIYMLLNYQKLRKIMNSVTERGVLILGRFGGGGLEVLQAIAAKLREMSYLPIIFDFERPQDRNYTETIKTLAGLARFVIADLSGPSVPQELYAIIPHFKIPFVPIIEASRKPFAMAVDLLEYPWVVRPVVTFATTKELLEVLPVKVIAPAEEKHQARQKLLDELFKKA